MSKDKIIFNQPYNSKNTFKNLEFVFASGKLSGDGHFTEECSKYLEEVMNVKSCLLTTSCTHALEMSALLLNIRPGDEVIFPSFTFVSTINAFVLRGAIPVYIDIRSDTLNIDERQIEKSITKKTKAIVIVHYGGIACEMDSIMKTSKKYNIPVIEDNAHGLFGKYKNKFLGTFGKLATQSFHETKNFSCGEGGALIINDSSLISRAEIIREKGTNRSNFFRGEVDKYGWVDLGSSYLLSDILAAVLYSQFEEREKIQNFRGELWNYYQTSLSQWALNNNISLPHVPDYCENPYHLFYLIMPSSSDRSKFIKHLKSKNISAVFHYLPLHSSSYGKKLGGGSFDLINTERISNCLVRIPLHLGISKSMREKIVCDILDYELHD